MHHKRSSHLLAFLAFGLVVWGVVFAVAQNPPAPAPAQTGPSTPRPIELRDIFAWRSIGQTVVSDDGRWFACRIAPQQGNGEVVFKRTDGSKEYSFPAGEGRGGSVAISADGRFGAFMINPDTDEARRLRRERKPMPLKACLVNLADGEKVEYDKIRSFSFSGENPAWIALHKSAPEGQSREKEKWTGSDLILRELASGTDLVLGNAAEFAFDKKGTRLAVLIDAYGMSGNGILLRDMATGAITALESDKASYQRLAWTENGDALVCLKGREDKDFEDKLFSVVGFSGFAAAGPQKTVYNPKEDKTFPEGMTVSPNRTPRWSESLDAILFGIHAPKKKSAEQKPGAGHSPEGAGPGGGASEVDEDMPDLVLWHGADKRLQSQQQVEAGDDKSYSYLSIYRVKEKKFIRLADDDVRDITPAPKELFGIGLDISDYELDGNLDGRRYEDVYVINFSTGVRTLALKKHRWMTLPSPDGTRFLYYDDGVYYVYDMAAGKSAPVSKDVPANFVNEDDDHNVKNPPDYPVGWTKDSRTVLLSDGWDIWAVSTQGGPGRNLTVDGRKDAIRYQRRLQIDREEKGIDLDKPVYFATYGEWTKKAGISVLEKGAPRPKALLWEDAGFGPLLKARKADVYLFTRDTFRDFPDWYAAGPALNNGLKLTEANPRQKDFLWSSGQILVDYRIDPASGKTDRLQGALFLPAN